MPKHPFILLFFLLLPTVCFANITSGLVGWWKMNEGTGTTVNDSSGSGNTGTTQNGPSWVSGRTWAYALSFTATNQSVTLASIGSLPVNTDTSVSFWMNTSDKTLFTTYYQLSDASGYGWQIQKRTGSTGIGVRVDTSFGANQVPINAGGVEDGQWHHIVITYTASTQVFAFYEDTVLKATSASPAYVGSLPAVATQGGISTSVSSEILNDMRVYNRVISASEVVQLFAAHTKSFSKMHLTHYYSTFY